MERPITPEGKALSGLNSIRTGENAQTLAQFVPPNSGILESIARDFSTPERFTRIITACHQAGNNPTS